MDGFDRLVGIGIPGRQLPRSCLKGSNSISRNSSFESSKRSAHVERGFKNVEVTDHTTGIRLPSSRPSVAGTKRRQIVSTNASDLSERTTGVNQGARRIQSVDSFIRVGVPRGGLTRPHVKGGRVASSG